MEYISEAELIEIERRYDSVLDASYRVINDRAQHRYNWQLEAALGSIDKLRDDIQRLIAMARKSIPSPPPFPPKQNSSPTNHEKRRTGKVRTGNRANPKRGQR